MTGEEVLPILSGAAKKALSEKPEIERQLAEMAKDSPAMKAAAESFAQRVAVKQAILARIYSPLARLVGAKTYFGSDFAVDMAQKLADIPDDELTDPAPSVAIPAMQGLSYSLDEPDLKEMYLSLLATATDARSTANAHPSFADIIKQLSAAEAKLLMETVDAAPLPIIELMHKAKEGAGEQLVCNHVLPLTDDETGEPTSNPMLAVWVDNWVRLGLVEVSYGRSFIDGTRYDWVTSRPEYLELAARDERGAEGIRVGRGLLRITDYGKTFARAVRPADPENSASI